MNKNYLLLLLFLPFFSSAQNLVPNGSFEDTVACPDNLTQIENAIGWMSFRFTPDYFHTCASGTVNVPVSIPHNIWGDQYAHTGNAYAGFGAYASAGSNTREYIATELNQQMIIGQVYYVSFWVSSAFGYLNNQYPGLACNNLGAKFSTVAYSQANPQPINNTAHIVDTNIINDTINWVKISGSFIADSAYQYISIGNFFDNSSTSYVFIGSLHNVAYYYLDEVRVSTDSLFVNNIDEHNFNPIKLYPNPARDWIEISGDRLSEILLYNILGNLCYKAAGLSASTLKINISNFSNGLYFINVKSAKENITMKILINK